jgi:hypothetical protein
MWTGILNSGTCFLDGSKALALNQPGKVDDKKTKGKCGIIIENTPSEKNCWRR